MATYQVLADFEATGSTFAISYNSGVGYGNAVIAAPSGRIVLGASIKLDTAADADQLSQIYAIVESDGSGIIIEAWPHNGSTFGTVNGMYVMNTAVPVTASL